MIDLREPEKLAVIIILTEMGKTHMELMEASQKNLVMPATVINHAAATVTKNQDMVTTPVTVIKVRADMEVTVLMIVLQKNLVTHTAISHAAATAPNPKLMSQHQSKKKSKI